MEVEAVHLGIVVAGTLATGGIAWGSTRQRLSHVEKKIDAAVDVQKKHESDDVDQHTEMVQRLTRIETLVTEIHKRV